MPKDSEFAVHIHAMNDVLKCEIDSVVLKVSRDNLAHLTFRLVVKDVILKDIEEARLVADAADHGCEVVLGSSSSFSAFFHSLKNSNGEVSEPNLFSIPLLKIIPMLYQKSFGIVSL